MHIRDENIRSNLRVKTRKMLLRACPQSKSNIFQRVVSFFYFELTLMKQIASGLVPMIFFLLTVRQFFSSKGFYKTKYLFCYFKHLSSCTDNCLLKLIHLGDESITFNLGVKARKMLRACPKIKSNIFQSIVFLIYFEYTNEK